MNKQLRKYFPKGKSVDSLTDERIKEVQNALNSAVLRSLNGFSQEYAFKIVYGEDLLIKITK